MGWLPEHRDFVALNSKELGEQLQERGKRLDALLLALFVEAWLLPAQFRCRRSDEPSGRPAIDCARASAYCCIASARALLTSQT